MVCVGDDWAEDHHDVELVDDEGRRLARARLPEGLDGITRLHALIAEHLPPAWVDLDPRDAAAVTRLAESTKLRIDGERQVVTLVFSLPVQFANQAPVLL